jgi:L-lysine 2,3-aminomutase
MGSNAEKNKFKASNYMGEIMQKDKEIQKIRLQLLDQEEEMRQLSITREKFIRERNHLLNEMKT